MTLATAQRVLVTGASGFVGRALVLGLAARGWRVRAAARDATAVPLADGIEPVTMPDLTLPADWRPLLTGVSHVVHLAGLAHSRAAIAEAAYTRVNATASGELAAAARNAGVIRFVLMSSVRAQAGPSAMAPLTEDAPPAPTDAYGRSKLAAEREVFEAFGSGATILRPVLVAGPGVKGNLAALARLARSPMPLPFGALRNRRSLLGLENLISIVDFALKAEAAFDRTYLAADPEPLTVADLIAAMRAAAGRKPGLIPVPPVLLQPALALVGRGALAQSLLGALVADPTALLGAGWRPVATTQAEIIRMVAAQTGPSSNAPLTTVAPH